MCLQEEVIKSLPKDEELVRWLRKDLINHVISYSKIGHPDILPSFMTHYVVYRLPPVVPIECTVATATIAHIGNSDVPATEVVLMKIIIMAVRFSADEKQITEYLVQLLTSAFIYIYS